VEQDQLGVYMTEENSINMDHFKIAFSAHNALDRNEIYDDPSKVQWVAQLSENDGTRDTKQQFIGVHKCGVQDYAEFYDIDEASSSMFKQMK
jgi:hypothetical protein